MGFCDGLRFMGFVYVGIEPDGILWYDINIEVCRVAFFCPEAENMAAAEGNPSAAMGTECTGGRRGKPVGGHGSKTHARPARRRAAYTEYSGREREEHMSYKGYLFAHFIGEKKDGEQVYFSVSRDGLHWRELNGGEPVLRSEIGEMGARDPFLIRSPWEGKDGSGKFYLIATDLRIEAGKGWEAAQYSGSRDILVWESQDLVSWRGPKAHTVGIPGAGCVWAPEAVYDEEQDAILVFWASMVDKKQRIYASYTRDFKSFSQPFLFLEKENHVIDSTIIRTEEGYYRYTKDETVKTICIDFSENLHPEDFREVKSETLGSLYGVEGPEIFRLDQGQWCLIVDRFAAGKGYLPLVTDRLDSGEFRILDDSEFDMGVSVKRHGGVIPITAEEYDRLCAAFGCSQEQKA